MTPDDRPVVVLGAGFFGICAALRLRSEQPGVEVRIIDPAPEPGGQLRTRRSAGYSCELGWQGLVADLGEVAWLLARLGLAQRVLPAAIPVPSGLAHAFFGPPGAATAECTPFTFRSGLEELVQAARRELAGSFVLGRPIVAVREDAVLLGGQVPLELSAHRVVRTAHQAAVPVPSVWFGFERSDAEACLRGAGLERTPGEDPRILAALYCSNLWPGCTLPGKFLVRIVLTRLEDPEAQARTVDAWLRARTGLSGRCVFRRI